ncbi:Pol polyprotein [Plakobranchus ocellatus]|uniref:Pol polyprotein n=1 Tax=Plakobranchus ocellatus TaxID=259542 RepID=A0AAV4E0J7_9GAST|nr:Pol polyprotein [Plakobranchus ocellatus]
MEVISEPFQKVVIDLVGPLPITKKGNSYILTLIDTATRYPEAISIPNCTSETIANVLFEIFSRLGIPKQVLSDNARQLISESMQETYRLLGISQRLSAPHHPISHGAVERWNQTLQKILVKLIEDSEHEWDEMLPAALFAVRHMPNAATKYPPFELMLGRKVRGPIDVIADLCNNVTVDEDLIQAYTYADKLKKIIRKANLIASRNAEEFAKDQKTYYDQRTHPRYFKKHDKVLVLLPKKGNSLYLAYQGPYSVVKRKGDNYYIQIGKYLRVYHANILKLYHERNDDIVYMASLGYIDEDKEETEEQPQIEFYQHTVTQNYNNAKIDEDLTPFKNWRFVRF